MPTGEEVREYYQKIASGEVDPCVFEVYKTGEIPDGIKGAINGILSKASGGNDNRKLVLKYLAGVTSSKALSRMQWYALYCLVVPYKDEALGWVSDNPRFQSATNAILAGMARIEGQREFEL